MFIRIVFVIKPHIFSIIKKKKINMKTFFVRLEIAKYLVESYKTSVPIYSSHLLYEMHMKM